jgi:hypothetical protein
MASGFNKRQINGMTFLDVTNETSDALHLMTYEEAYAYSLGYRPSVTTFETWKPKSNKEKEKNRENP